MLRRIRDKYGVAAAQIGDTEVRNVSELGFSFVSNDESYAQDVMNGVIREIEAKSEAEAVDIQQEMVHFG